MTYGQLHSWTLLSASAAPYECFAAACAGGGTPPQWTECGPDPLSWEAPPDASGGLVLWYADGTLDRCSPQVWAEGTAGPDGGAYEALLNSGLVRGVVRASYASSGGRMVALCAVGDEWAITIGRMETTPRCGTSEANILALDPGARVLVLEESPINANAEIARLEGELRDTIRRESDRDAAIDAATVENLRLRELLRAAAESESEEVPQ